MYTDLWQGFNDCHSMLYDEIQSLKAQLESARELIQLIHDERLPFKNAALSQWLLQSKESK
jgi:hypothetical protein